MKRSKSVKVRLKIPEFDPPIVMIISPGIGLELTTFQLWLEL